MADKCLLLLSGGMDSSTLLYDLLYNRDLKITALGFDYNQRHRVELRYAKKLCDMNKVPFNILNINLSQIGGSPLVDIKQEVPTSMKKQVKTVVPFRNTILLSYAAAFAEVHNIEQIYITPCKEDYDAYRDCRTNYYSLLQQTLNAGSTYGPSKYYLTIFTPYINITKKEIIKKGLDLKVPYEFTHSCYNGLRPPCGKCPACIERVEAFKANNIEDPIFSY